jgi:biopolymer transport protein ExbD
VAPNAINLLLPKSDSGKQLASRNIEVYIDADRNYYVNPKEQKTPPVPYEELLFVSIILRADKSVPIECVVAFYDVLNALNAGLEETQRYRMLLATEAKS